MELDWPIMLGRKPSNIARNALIVQLYGEIIVHLEGKSTKFGMEIVFKLLNNISYGPQLGGSFVLRGVG